MQLDLSENCLPIYCALANPVRLEILRSLADGSMNITQLASRLGLSKAIITRHVAQLEAVQLIKTSKKPGRSGLQKISSLSVDTIEITFPAQLYRGYQLYHTETKVGHYSDFKVEPTCGLATTKSLIGQIDDTIAFVLPERVEAALLWFSSGYVEYKLPCALETGQVPRFLEISFEIASEFPGSNNVWPSDITFHINGVEVGTWTCPGNFSDVRGFFTPDWWSDDASQYGLLRPLRINANQTEMDSLVLSKVGLAQLDLPGRRFLDLRFSVKPDAKHAGGLTLFGRGFGNHPQDIDMKLYYEDFNGQLLDVSGDAVAAGRS